MADRIQLLPVTDYAFAEHANTANSAIFALTAGLADYATNALHANTANSANTANVANTANTADNANHANTADVAGNANNSTYFAGHPLSDFLLANANYVLLSNTIILNAQMKTLNTAPVQLIPSPGAGNIIQLLQVTMRCVMLATYNVSITPTMRFANGNTNWNFGLVYMNQIQDKMVLAIGEGGTSFANTAECINKAVVLCGNYNLTGGNVGNYLSIECTYIIIPVP